MKIIYFIGGIILLFIAIVPVKRHLKEYEVQKQGELVKVVLTSVPRGKGSIDFNYNGGQYDKKVGSTFYQDYEIGDTLVLKHKEETDIFLFENESVESEFVAFGLLGLFGVFMLIKGAKSSTNKRKQNAQHTSFGKAGYQHYL